METHPLTDAVVTVEATDADDKDPHKTIRYEIESNSQYRDRFTLDPVTGQLFLRRTLVGETTNQYTVSWHYFNARVKWISSDGTDLEIFQHVWYL